MMISFGTFHLLLKFKTGLKGVEDLLHVTLSDGAGVNMD
jgi:hypothetical protein